MDDPCFTVSHFDPLAVCRMIVPPLAEAVKRPVHVTLI